VEERTYAVPFSEEEGRREIRSAEWGALFGYRRVPPMTRLDELLPHRSSTANVYPLDSARRRQSWSIGVHRVLTLGRPQLHVWWQGINAMSLLDSENA
jgi:hypothetical protein